MREVRETFPFGNYSDVLVLECDDFFQPQRIAVLRRLAAQFDELAPEQPVIWIGRIPKVGQFPIASLLPSADASPEDYQQARDEALRHPLVARPPALARRQDDAHAARRALDNQRGGTIRERVVRGFGNPCASHRVRRHAYQTAFDEDHVRIVVTACLLVVVLAMIIFRGVAAMVIVASGPVLGLVWTLGLLDLFGRPGNDLTEIILPVMILMIGMTDGVHLVLHIRQARTEGMAPREAARSAVYHVGRACALTSITTAIGFGSLTISDSSFMREFGHCSAIGVLVTFWAVILVIPLLSSSWLGRRIHSGTQRDLIGMGMHRLSGLPQVVVARARWVAAGGILFTVFLAAGAIRLEPDDRLAYTAPHSSEAYQALVDVDHTFGGLQLVQTLLEWPTDAEYDEIWQVLDQTERLFSEEPLAQWPLSVRNWLSIFPGSESPKKLMRARLLPKEYRDLFWHAPTRRALVVARVQDLSVARYDGLVKRLTTGLANLEQQHPGFTLRLTGISIVRGRRIRQLVGDLLESLMLAAGVIFVVLTLAYRSLRLGLICVIPNVFPLAATAALRAAWDPSLDIASACSFTICLGIAVDDTIHFVTRFQHEIENGTDKAIAIRRTFIAVGSALVMTTVIMIAGFGTVLTSQMPTHRSFATLGCITLAAALLADLVILPALLVCFTRRTDLQNT